MQKQNNNKINQKIIFKHIRGTNFNASLAKIYC